MLKRGGKSSYNPYSTTQRVKKPEWKERLDILPNRHGAWLKQVGPQVQTPPFCGKGLFSLCQRSRSSGAQGLRGSGAQELARLPSSPHPSGSVAQRRTGSCESLRRAVFAEGAKERRAADL